MSLHIVFQKPSIAENIGNIIRTCVGFGAELHMIRPYGFIWNPSKIARSSTNHMDQCVIHQYDDWEEFYAATHHDNSEYYFYTRYGKKAPSDFHYDLTSKDIYLVFGNEHYGIDKDILKAHLDTCVRIPMTSDLICLNVANSAAIAAYEVVKQNNYPNLELEEIFNKEW
ncbi:TrmH family RNA methyltransferase [Ureaplasma ceti]|uniref:Putative tRNA (cytidine(34)-2'-O)-methyltransferase n=1 Tax=Ureaplasma ceti TaxID=3119530 RepID=A0ABP9U8B0_9BACT